MPNVFVIITVTQYDGSQLRSFKTVASTGVDVPYLINEQKLAEQLQGYVLDEIKWQYENGYGEVPK